MAYTIQIDASGRLVLPKAVRERLNLTAGANLRAEVVAGRIELTPVADVQKAELARKAGIAVLKHTGVKADAAAAIVSEREALAFRSAGAEG